MIHIPIARDIEIELEFNKFISKFLIELQRAVNENKKCITVDLENYKYKNEIISYVISKGYSIQHMKYKEMHAVTWN